MYTVQGFIPGGEDFSEETRDSVFIKRKTMVDCIILINHIKPLFVNFNTDINLSERKRQ